jgi:hypothetical protein
MNESTLTQLKIIVERSVRPVRASTYRKRTMREELLAHLSAAYEEELAKLGDERAALERTTQRFGNPAEVTLHLQESVPKRDALDLFVDNMWLQTGDTTFRRAIRHALLVECWLVVYILLVMTVYVAKRGLGWMDGIEWPQSILWVSGSWVLSACFLFVFGCTFLAEWMRRSLYGPAANHFQLAALVLIGGPLLLAVLGTWGVWLGGQDNFWTTPSGPPGVLFFGITTSAILLALAQANHTRMTYAEEWAGLTLENES